MSETPARLSIIAAMAANRVIGIHNRLPWHLPADLLHFKQLTLGKPMIMGRKTWESLPGLLPGRPHIVISRDPDYRAKGALLANTLESALHRAAEAPEAMVIGGAEIYRQALPLATDLYLTLIGIEPEGDAFFPHFEQDRWQLHDKEEHDADPKNAYPYSFLHYCR